MLDRTLYLDRVGIFTFDRLACLRNAYANNDCKICLEVCSYDAFVFEEGKLRLIAARCTQCGVCIGGCPTHALSLYGFSIDHALEKLKNEENMVFTCKESSPCLAAFSVEAWSVLLLEGGRDIFCSLCVCKECPLNVSQHIHALIIQRIEEANRLMVELDKAQRIKILEARNAKPSSRRTFFKTFIKPSANTKEPSVPLLRLKKALKSSLDDTKQITEPLAFIHQKKISIACDNCKECVQFCPTQALSYSTDQSKILFQMGKCIGCFICESICKQKAINTENAPFEIMHFAYDRAEILIEHDLQVCLTCKCAFSYKGGKKECERCASFEKEHAELFILASQSE